MERPNRESFFFDSLTTTLPKQVNNADNDDVPDYEDFDDDASLFTTASIDSASGRDIYGNPTLCPGPEDDELDVHLDSENRQNLPLHAFENSNTEDAGGVAELPALLDSDAHEDSTNPFLTPKPTITKSRSIAHDHFEGNKLVFVSFDMETGGEFCGILQISAELVRIEVVPKITSKGPSPNMDTAKVIKREGSVFNEFVRAEEGAIFNSHATAIHGLTAEHENIVNAAKIETVWDQFRRWFYAHLRDDEVAVLVAWNGETCDLKWLWKLTQAPLSPCYLPEEMIYFMDPMKTLQHYKSCKLNHNHSKLDSYELGVVWSHVNGGANLNGAHDSLVDARAQTDIIIDEHYVPFLNKSASIHPIDEIFTKCEQNKMKKKMDPSRLVHSPWV